MDIIAAMEPKKRIWSYFLLIALTLSVFHDTTFAILCDDSYVATEHKVEFVAKHHLNDIHEKYHFTNVPMTAFNVPSQSYKGSEPIFKHVGYLFKFSHNLLKPPISI